MKILLVSHSCIVPAYREKLDVLCARKDVELTLLLPRHWAESGKRFDSRGMADPRYRILSRSIFFEGQVGWHFYPFFMGAARQTAPDIIHVEEEPFSLVAGQAQRAAAQLGARFVFTTWENIQERLPFPQNLIRERVIGHADHALTGDLEMKRILVRAGFPAKKVSLVPHGVNPKIFKREGQPSLRKKLGLKGFVIGYMGRLVTEKGVLDLVEAVRRMKKETTLCFVGNGPAQLEIERRIRETGCRQCVRFVSAVAYPEVPQYLNCMDTLVLPSRTTPGWKEQFGRVLIEAMACEVPVVGSSSGSIPGVIGKAGFIFPEGDAPALSAVLDRLVSSKALCRRTGALGRKRVLERFTPQHLADEIYAIYHGLLR